MKILFFRSGFVLALLIFSSSSAYFNEDKHLYLFGSRHGNMNTSDSKLIDCVLEIYKEKKALVFNENPTDKIIFSESLVNYNLWDLGRMANRFLNFIDDCDDCDDCDFSRTVYIHKPISDPIVITGYYPGDIDPVCEVLKSHRLAKKIFKKTNLNCQNGRLPDLIIKNFYEPFSDIKVSVINTKKN